jgi:phosphatidylglycerol---prolipoprotein diacylglyceryl transferase
MLQELFRIPFINWPIHSFGLMMVLGLLAAMQVAKMLARRSRIDPEFFVNAGLLALVSGVVGARISHVIENFRQYTRADRSVIDNLWAAVNLGDGGLTYYGGFLLAFPTLVVYAIIKKVPVRVGMDVVAPCLMIALGIGRVGCFLNGCCYGAPCQAPWAVTFPYHSYAYVDGYRQGHVDPPPQLLIFDEGRGPRPMTPAEVRMHADLTDDASLIHLATQQRSHRVHPAQLYSAFTALLLAAVLIAYFTLPHAAGNVFSVMLILEGLARFNLEMLRVEPPVMPELFGRMSFAMVLSIGMIALGTAMWFLFRAWSPRYANPAISPTPA